jgi:hypothetical protein
MKKVDQVKRNGMRSIRISDDLVLVVNPDRKVLESSVNWTDWATSDPGITSLELLVYVVRDLEYRASLGTLQSKDLELDSCLPKIYGQVRILEKLVAEMLAEQSRKKRGGSPSA